MNKTILFSIFSTLILASCASTMPMQGGMIDDHETTIAKCGVGNYTFYSLKDTCGTPATTTTTAATETTTAVKTVSEVKAAHQVSKFATLTDKKIEISKEVTFGTGSAALTAEGKKILNEVANVITANETMISKVEVEGHTDTTGNATKNMTLSEARANTVKLYLAGKGIDSGKLTAKGFGQTKPKFDPTTATKAERAGNRRVEFNVETTGTSRN